MILLPVPVFLGEIWLFAILPGHNYDKKSRCSIAPGLFAFPLFQQTYRIKPKITYRIMDAPAKPHT